MGDAHQFAIELEQEFQREVEGRLNEVIQKIGIELLQSLVMKSPVDSGRFRGAWSVTIGEPSHAETGRLDPSGAATIQEGTAVITGLTEAQAIWLQNATPYALRIENGWSGQAPAGVVAVSVAEIETMFERSE